MPKTILHIFLSFLLLLSLTGVSTAATACIPFQKMQQAEQLTNEKCCEVTKELKKLDIDLSSDRNSVSVPEIDFIPVSLINFSFDPNVARLLFERSELEYQQPLQSRDIPVLNQNFRI